MERLHTKKELRRPDIEQMCGLGGNCQQITSLSFQGRDEQHVKNRRSISN